MRQKSAEIAEKLAETGFAIFGVRSTVKIDVKNHINNHSDDQSSISKDNSKRTNSDDDAKIECIEKAKEKLSSIKEKGLRVKEELDKLLEEDLKLNN